MTTAQASDGFLNIREVTKRTRLAPGTYCVIPFSANTADRGQFLLRLLTAKENTAYSHDNTDPTPATPASVTLALEGSEWKQAKELFVATAGEGATVDAFQIKSMLSKLQGDVIGEDLSLDTCRRLLALHDHDHTGSIDILEFHSLWATLHTWKKSFLKHCEKSGGGLKTTDLRSAMQSTGCAVNSTVLNAVATSYANENGCISFQDFVQTLAKVQTMTEIFKTKTTADAITITLDEWLKSAFVC
uniref:Calcium dependent cysteine n=1 Tax=Alectorobius mimon TaxID=360319 RepID=A0A147B9F2_9ACAR